MHRHLSLVIRNELHKFFGEVRTLRHRLLPVTRNKVNITLLPGRYNEPMRQIRPVYQMQMVANSSTLTARDRKSLSGSNDAKCGTALK